MSGAITFSRVSDAEELPRKREELAALLAEVEERESELATLREELLALEHRYLTEIGDLYLELDAWNARIQQLRLHGNPDAAADVHCSDPNAPPDVCDANPDAPAAVDLKALYRDAARKLHPDLASDPAEQERRNRFMAEANRAYEAADVEALQRILADFHYSASAPGTTVPESAAEELLRIVHEIRDARARHTAAQRQLGALRGMEIFHLRRDVETAAAQGRDFFAELAENIRTQIRRAEKIHASLLNRPPRDITLPDAPLTLDISALRN